LASASEAGADDGEDACETTGTSLAAAVDFLALAAGILAVAIARGAGGAPGELLVGETAAELGLMMYEQPAVIPASSSVQPESRYLAEWARVLAEWRCLSATGTAGNAACDRPTKDPSSLSNEGVSCVPGLNQICRYPIVISLPFGPKWEKVGRPGCSCRGLLLSVN
jgi:hypothetical protein